MVLLTNCAQGSSNNCGHLVEYSKEYQLEAANELEDMKTKKIYPKTQGMILDYGITRKTIRKCRDNSS